MGRRREREIRAQVHAALAEFATAVEVRLHAEVERSQRTQLALVEALRAMHADLNERDASLVGALDRLGALIEHTTEFLEDDRAERRALVNALASSLRAGGELPMPTRGAPPRERVLGGTVYGGPADIDLVDAVDVADRAGVEVECRFGDRWVNGFEISDVVREGDELRFRVRRLSDSSVLPKLFDAAEVRRVPPPPMPTGPDDTSPEGAHAPGWHSSGR